MNGKNFSHLVEIDEATRQVKIFRVFADGIKQLYTQTDLPTKTVDEDKSGYDKFAQTLGENILLDSPLARKLIGF